MVARESGDLGDKLFLDSSTLTPLLKRMVLAGHYGRKSGKGFYDYS